MLKIITSLLVFAIGIAAQAQSNNNNLAHVTKVKVKNNIELVYTQSATAMLSTNSEEEEVFIKKYVKGNTLHLIGKNNHKGVIKVYLSTADMQSFKGSRGAKIKLTNPLETQNLEVILNSGAQFSGLTRTLKTTLYANYGTVFNGRLETKRFLGNFENSIVNLSGTADYSVIKAEDLTRIYAKNFIPYDSTVIITSHSSIEMHGAKKMQFVTDESARVTYFDYPEAIKVNNTTVASN